MEESPTQIGDIMEYATAPHEIEMLRSGKGKDMLLVDCYIYYYDDRSTTAYRWVCSRRKDTPPCRVRLYTTLVDDLDLTRHNVQRMTSTHNHGPASEDAIRKGREKKKQAIEAGFPCTLDSLSQKRRRAAFDDDAGEMSGIVSPTNVKRVKQTPPPAFDYDNADTLIEEDEESSDDDFTPLTEKLKRKQEQQALQAQQSKSVLILKTSKGHHMIAVEGCVYRLDGKSVLSCTYRWKCFRSKDLQCSGRIYTECLANGQHRYKPIRLEETVHNHQPYSDVKIDALIRRNNIKILQGTKTNISPTKSTSAKVPKEPKKIPLSVGKLKGTALSISTALPKPGGKLTPKQEKANAFASQYCYVEDPAELLKEPRKDSKIRFSFLPSLKGNRILVVDNVIFHYDSRGSSATDRTYWTCLYRRDKRYKCYCRATTEYTDENTRLVNITGLHKHENHRDKIEKRIDPNKLIEIKATKSEPEDAEYYEDNDAGGGVGGGNEISRESSPDISQFLKIKKEKNVVEDLLEIDCTKVEVDPFQGTTEYIEMERVNDESYQQSDDNYEDSDDMALKPRQTRHSTRKTIKQEYDADFEYSPTSNKKSPETGRKYKKRDSNEIKSNPDNIDPTNILKLRSAKGGELLCVDGYIYHLKSVSVTTRTYWACIKSKSKDTKCNARVTTITSKDNKIKVVAISNSHSHPVSENDIKKRLFNEFSQTTNTDVKSKEIMSHSLRDLNPQLCNLLDKRRSATMGNNMKLYAVSDGPPSLAVRMCLKALNISHELHNVDYIASEHLSEEYAKLNPQKEIPVLDDNGFYLSESIAIMQYLCDKYAPDSNLYPQEANERAVVNHRLCFNTAFYYSAIGAYTMAPIFFDYKRTEKGLKKVNNALQVFETYLERAGTKYAAAEHLTIADFALISATICLEAIAFDLTPYPLICRWYNMFKKNYPELWKIADTGMQEIIEFEQNPPDLSHMNHPFHPVRK